MTFVTEPFNTWMEESSTGLKTLIGGIYTHGLYRDRVKILIKGFYPTHGWKNLLKTLIIMDGRIIQQVNSPDENTGCKYLRRILKGFKSQRIS